MIKRKSYILKKIKKVINIFLLTKFLNKKEKRLAVFFLFLVLLGIIGLLVGFRLSGSKVLPAEGGIYKEALLGYPQYLNPVLGYANDVDRDIVKLVYSGLMKFDADGNLIPDLAEDFEISNGNKTYDFYLRKNVFWHDGEKFDANDIIYTIRTIQDAKYNSPLRFNWEGVSVEKINDWQIRFSLRYPYAPFLTNVNVGILPEHIWQNYDYENFAVAQENTYPIGTGPFVLDSVKKDDQGLLNNITLKRNDDYYLKKAYLEKIVLSFCLSEEDLITKFNKNKVDGIALNSSFKKSEIKDLETIDILSPTLPRYFSVFLNQENKPILKDKNLRLALAHSTNKEIIIEEVFNGDALKIKSPLLPHIFNNESNEIKEDYKYDPNKAKEYLEKVTNYKEIEITLSVPDVPELKQTAEMLQEEWLSLGIQVKISLISLDNFVDDVIRPRNYETVIFGQVLSLNPDPFSFWHSSQKNDPGLNLALYDNNSVDSILESIRQEDDVEKRLKLYKEFEDQICKDLPAIFLYSPKYLYLLKSKIKGVRLNKINLPADRFSSIENWYINTRFVK